MVESKKKTSASLTSQVLKIVDMVEYQDGSVVSRTLIDKPTGTVTLFAFAAGQGLSEHTAPFDAMVHVVDGEAEVSISSQPFHLRSGDEIIMPAGKPHALKAPKRFKMVLTMIKS